MEDFFLLRLVDIQIVSVMNETNSTASSSSVISSHTLLNCKEANTSEWSQFLYSGTPVMRPQLLPHKNGHMRGVVVCQGHELF